MKAEKTNKKLLIRHWCRCTRCGRSEPSLTNSTTKRIMQTCHSKSFGNVYKRLLWFCSKFITISAGIFVYNVSCSYLFECLYIYFFRCVLVVVFFFVLFFLSCLEKKNLKYVLNIFCRLYLFIFFFEKGSRTWGRNIRSMFIFFS